MGNTLDNVVKIPARDKEFDKCVLCGKLTDVKKTTHIDLRPHYVEGVGQLHPSCYNQVYTNKKRERTILEQFSEEY